MWLHDVMRVLLTDDHTYLLLETLQSNRPFMRWPITENKFAISEIGNLTLGT